MAHFGKSALMQKCGTLEKMHNTWNSAAHLKNAAYLEKSAQMQKCATL